MWRLETRCTLRSRSHETPGSSRHRQPPTTLATTAPEAGGVNDRPGTD
jgi:hypothetical protein